MIISRTPMRASFFGGGTDFSGYYQNSKFGFGNVLSTAVNMYIYITVNKKFDDLIRVSYSKTELVDSVDKIEHNIIREAMKIAGIEKGVDIVYMGDVPLGSAGIGLASSSALAVGVLNALFAYKGEHVSAEFLAEKACEIEINALKNPIGKQDQFAVAYGGFNTYRFNHDESVFVTPLICKDETKHSLESNLMFFYTGITRISSHILAEQKANIPDKTAFLDRMVEMVSDGEEALRNNNFDQIGLLLDEGWRIKKKLSGGISNPEIDNMYEKAIKSGAIGGKILGAGGGGFLMLYVPIENQPTVKEALSEYRKIDIKFEPQGSKIIYVG